MPGIKHLIECHCVLAIFKSKEEKIIFHKFPTYSKIDENEKVIPKLEFGRPIDDLSPKVNLNEIKKYLSFKG